jgi:predicted nicotinamide N-methyase
VFLRFSLFRLRSPSWRAAEHLCQYIIDYPEVFNGKSVCEVGSGLGLVSILLEKLNYCSELVVTDGDEDTLQLLIENKIDNDCLFDTSYLLWGEHDDFLSDHSAGFDILIGADIIYEEEQIFPLLLTVSALMKSKIVTWFVDRFYLCCLPSLSFFFSFL